MHALHNDVLVSNFPGVEVSSVDVVEPGNDFPFKVLPRIEGPLAALVDQSDLSFVFELFRVIIFPVKMLNSPAG